MLFQFLGLKKVETKEEELRGRESFENYSNYTYKVVVMFADITLTHFFWMNLCLAGGVFCDGAISEGKLGPMKTFEIFNFFWICLRKTSKGIIIFD